MHERGPAKEHGGETDYGKCWYNTVCDFLVLKFGGPKSHAAISAGNPLPSPFPPIASPAVMALPLYKLLLFYLLYPQQIARSMANLFLPVVDHLMSPATWRSLAPENQNHLSFLAFVGFLYTIGTNLELEQLIALRNAGLVQMHLLGAETPNISLEMESSIKRNHSFAIKTIINHEW